jgi:hypothetical protein
MAKCLNSSEFPMYPSCTRMYLQAASLKDQAEVDKSLIEYAKACIEAQVIKEEATVKLADTLKKISENLDLSHRS